MQFIRWIVIAFTLALAGCASAPDRVAKDSTAKLRRIAPVSLVGSTFERRYTGFTVFGNERESKDVSSWNLDEQYEAQLRRALADVDGKLELVPVPGRADLAKAAAGRGGWQAGDFRGSRWEAMKEPVKSTCSAARADALVVMLPQWSEDFLARTNQFFGGLGFYVRGIGDRTAVSVMHLLAYVAVVDCTTGEALASRVLSRFQAGNYGDRVRGQALADMPPSVTRTPVGDWSADTQDRIRQAAVDLPAAAWEPTLRALFTPE